MSRTKQPIIMKAFDKPAKKQGKKKQEPLNLRPQINNSLLLNTVVMENDGIIQARAPRMPRNATKMINGVYEKGFSNNDMFSRKYNFSVLRKVYKASGLLQAIVSRRDFQCHQIAKKWKFEGDVGFRIVHENHHDQDFTMPESFNPIIKDMERMILKPWGTLEPTLSGFMSKYVKDLLVTNRPAIELGLDSKRMPRAFGMIDGVNLYPTYEVVKALIGDKSNKGAENLYPNSMRYNDALGVVAEKFNLADLTEKTEWIYMEDMVPRATYAADEIILLPLMPTTNLREFGFPPSMVENSIKLVLAEMLAMSYNMNYFQFGTMIDTIIGIVGSYDDPHIMEFIETIRTNHTGVDGAHRVPVVPIRNPEDIHIYNTRQNNRDMVYGDFMNLVTAFCCSIFGMPPDEINIQSRAGGGNFMFEGNHQKQIQQNKEEGLYTVRNHFKLCMDSIVERINPELCFEWWGLSETTDRVRKESAQKELASGGISVREYRQMTGKKPVPVGMKDEDVDIFYSQIWLAAKQGAQQQEQPQPSGDDDSPDNGFFSQGDDEYEENTPDFGEKDLEEEEE